MAGKDVAAIPSRPRIELRPNLSTAEACRRQLLALLEVMEARRPGVLEDLDPEFLHDFRVALRRTRSLLRELHPAFDAALLQPHLDEFRWLGQLTGPVRDLDVHLLHLPRFEAALPADLAAALAPLRTHLQQQRQRARQRLRRGLRAPRYARLITNWREALTADPLFTERARRPIGTEITSKTRRAIDRVLKRADAVPAQHGEAALHRLRIACKRLRYLLEFAQPLLSAKASREVIGKLKQLQDLLGEHQDAVVQQAALEALGDDSARMRQAVALLTQQLQQRREELRTSLDQRMADFSHAVKGRRLRQLLSINGEAG